MTRYHWLLRRISITDTQVVHFFLDPKSIPRNGKGYNTLSSVFSKIKVIDFLDQQYFRIPEDMFVCCSWWYPKRVCRFVAYTNIPCVALFQVRQSIFHHCFGQFGHFCVETKSLAVQRENSHNVDSSQHILAVNHPTYHQCNASLLILLFYIFLEYSI